MIIRRPARRPDVPHGHLIEKTTRDPGNLRDHARPLDRVLIRTVVLFVAGAVAMNYSSFFFYDVIGGILWVLVCAGAGYGPGDVPVVKEKFSFVVSGVIAISLPPVAIEMLRKHRTRTPVQVLD